MKITDIIIFIIIIIILYLLYHNISKKENFNLEVTEYNNSFDDLPIYVKTDKKSNINDYPNVYKKKCY